MSLGRPAKMINQRRFGSTILAPSACHTQKPLLEAGPIDLSLGSRHCLDDRGCPHCLHRLHETPRTVGVSEREIGRIYAMCLSIGPLRDPVLTTKGRPGLVSNESADTTNGEQRRLSPRRGGEGFMSYLSEYGFNSHTLPPSFIICSAVP